MKSLDPLISFVSVIKRRKLYVYKRGGDDFQKKHHFLEYLHHSIHLRLQHSGTPSVTASYVPFPFSKALEGPFSTSFSPSAPEVSKFSLQKQDPVTLLPILESSQFLLLSSFLTQCPPLLLPYGLNLHSLYPIL